ncbi:hypothetical protein ACJRO7_021620 [Eucalyptus globulus]|uniref:TIR domain-containing protein n=1 Tax=Eucalyptus globulus TaxID=34317 RepID=A0ABD3KPY7_EUCGL
MHRRIKRRKTNASGNAEDVDTGASGSMTAPIETNSVGSGSSPTETNNNASTGNCYEVFLSFRGLDTRHGFADHLYHGLFTAGIDTFRDDDELRQGEYIKPELLAAIRNSKISIPILSVNYGTSSWCLDELVQIMECKNNKKQIVLPIFYKVKPADVRYQKGNFGDAFHERERRLLERHSFDPAILEKWKQALLEVSNLKGYETDGSEAQLVKSVVRNVLNELKKKFELIISKNLVGIDSHVKNVMELLDDKSHALLFVGIHGMGGIGKTTLAKTIYNKLSNQFEHRSFIADIRESWKRGAHDLQNQLIFDISNQKNEVCNKDEGINFISSRFKDRKVLLLLDDVDNVDQVKCLAGNHDWFSLGSKIIITARNERILDLAGVDHNYGLTELDPDQSLILFSKHAFRRDFPPSEFEGLTREVVSTAGGLPLSLEVLGSLCCGRESREWRDMIKKLEKVPRKEVQEKLRISYDALDYEQKQIFLDIACLLIGIDKRIAFYMWDACDFFPGENIEVLRFMSLIKIGDDLKLRMHDQLRDLGRVIVREENQPQPWHRSRLWDSEEALKVLKRNKGTEKIEAIDLSKGNIVGSGKTTKQDGDIYTAKQFKNMTILRFLYMKGAHLSGDFEDSMEELKWLRWPNCPMNFEVNNFHVEQLAVIELPFGEINEKWEGWSFFKMAEKLQYLDLSNCESLENTDFLSAFKKLEVLILNGCKRLKQIEASIGDMEALLRLELCRCVSLTKLPAEIGKLKELEQLLLRGTRSLSALPDSIGSLENLEILEISESDIRELPNSIGRLRKLRELHARSCINLNGEMAESMCNLSSLQHLDFLCCFKLQSLSDLPSSLTNLGITCRNRKLPWLTHLTHLKELRVWSCNSLECIQVLPSTCSQPTDVEESKSPESLNTPFKLEILKVRVCYSIKTLDVLQFIHLMILYVEKCDNLLEIRGLDKSIYLESLTVTYCNSIERLDLRKFEDMKKLNVEGCNKLAEIQDLDKSEYLESSDIELCTSTKRLDLPKCRRLKEVNTRGCKNLVKIEGLDRLECLERLDIHQCTLIERLDFPKFGRLKELDAGECEKLAEIQGLDGLEYLERLDIEGCTLIKRLDLPKSGRLKELKLKGCINLAEIQGLNRLEYLQMLHIHWCTSMEGLDLLKFRRLKELNAEGCENLAKIQGLDRSEYLERLDITWCTSMGRLDLPKSGRLNELKVGGCKNLVEIQGLDRSEHLESLDITGCTSIERLDLPKSGSLKKLTAGGCKNLVEIQSLDRLEFLERLDVSKCTSIGRLDLPKSGSLKILNAYSCKKLVEIQSLERLEYLEILDISRCTSIERLLLPKSRSLKKLKARDCKSLIEIQGLDRLEFLEELNIIGCKSLKTIPELSGMQIYRYFEITDGKTRALGSDYMDDSDE